MSRARGQPRLTHRLVAGVHSQHTSRCPRRHRPFVAFQNQTPESRAELAHRHFDVAGAVSGTAGMMVLVYAITRATQHGWGDGITVGLLASAAALIVAFVGIETRSPAPLLPLRIFRMRTLSAANATSAMVGAAAFGQFFLLALYLQQVLG